MTVKKSYTGSVTEREAKGALKIGGQKACVAMNFPFARFGEHKLPEQRTGPVLPLARMPERKTQVLLPIWTQEKSKCSLI